MLIGWYVHDSTLCTTESRIRYYAEGVARCRRSRYCWSWGNNATYATKRATRAEIEELFSNGPTIRTNLRGRTATHLALGVSDAGRKLTVAFIYHAETNTAYPITAWEQT